MIAIDGFNLYFGSLKRTSYRWLDIPALVKRICNEQNPRCELVAIKYYTADVKAKLSSRKDVSCKAQNDYHLSLQAYNSARGLEFAIIKGKYNIRRKEYYAYQKPVHFDEKLSVWVSEEKQTDVAIAVDLLCDVMDDACDQVVVFSVASSTAFFRIAPSETNACSDSDSGPMAADLSIFRCQARYGIQGAPGQGDRHRAFGKSG